MNQTNLNALTDFRIERASLHSPVPLSFAVAAMNGRTALFDREIFGVSLDSRLCLEGDLFFCLNGSKTSGDSFIPEALERGAIPVSRSRVDGGILVEDPISALLSLSSAVFKVIAPKAKVIMITGSCGKTTTKDFLKAILATNHTVAATEKNYNNAIGLPMTAFSAGPDTEYLILEAGMNHPGELRAYSNAFSPDLALITNIGNAHIGNFSDRKAIAEAKCEIFEGIEKTGHKLIPADEPLLEAVEGAKTVSLSGFGVDYSCDVRIQLSAFSICSFKAPDRTLGPLVLPFAGRDTLTCFAFAAAAAAEIGIDTKDMYEGIAKLQTPARRIPTEVFGRLFLNDSYNASPESVIAALSALDLYRQDPKSVLLGDMEELGDASEHFHRLVGREICNHSIKSLFLFGKKAADIGAGAMDAGFPPSAVYSVEDATDYQSMIELLLNHTAEGELILCKASHRIRLGEIVERLKIQSTFEV